MMEDTICLQCGDIGFANAFVYCVKCLDFAVHRYCLDEIPETIDEFVRWVCDDCAAKLRSEFHVRKCDRSPSYTRVSSIVPKNIDGLTQNGIEEINSVVVKTGIGKPVCKDGPVQSYDARAEFHLVECGKSANQCTLTQSEGKNDEQNSSSQQLEEEKAKANSQKNTTKKKRKKMRKLKVIECQDQHKLSKVSTKHSYEESMKVDPTVSARSASNSTLPSKLKENKASHQPSDSDNGLGSLEHPVVSAEGHGKTSKKPKIVEVSMLISKSKEPDLGNRCAELFEERKVDVGLSCVENGEPEERTSSTVHRSNTCINDPKDVDEDVAAAKPVVMPIWRGCFSILNKEYYNLDEIVAHASSKACGKVYDTASQFELMLQFEMLPKSEIWPKSFQKSEPTDENIALYFFPSKRSEQDFDILVEKMMNEELGLKAVVQNAELLIFNSTELPLRYWSID